MSKRAANVNLSIGSFNEVLNQKEPLNIGISIYAPASIVSGSARFFYLQPIFMGRTFASAAILIAAQMFLFFADRILGHELTTESVPPAQRPTSSESGVSETTDAPLTVAFSVWGDFTDQPFSPVIFLLFPLFTLSNVRGSLPMLILELLTTIFVRSVTPPETTGSKALPETDPIRDNP